MNQTWLVKQLVLRIMKNNSESEAEDEDNEEMKSYRKICGGVLTFQVGIRI